MTARLLAALDAYGRSLDDAAAFLSPEREAERRRQFEENMAELAACRAELSALLSPAAMQGPLSLEPATTDREGVALGQAIQGDA